MKTLDLYYGRGLVKIDSEQDGTWFVELVGGVRVVNTDGRYAKPQIDGDIKRLTFLTTIMEESKTQMVVGLLDADSNIIEEFRIPLSPINYQIVDGDDVSRPQAGGYGAVTEAMERRRQGRQNEDDVPPHPDERAVEEPLGEHDFGDAVDKGDYKPSDSDNE
jgi:hypothetical protein